MKKMSQGILIIALVLFVAGVAQADSLMLAASDFIPAQPNDPGLDCYIGWHLYNYSGATYRHFFAPVHLPQGAQISSVVVYYKDNCSGSVNIQLERRNMYTLTVQEMAEWDTEGEVDGLRNYKITPVLYWTINNEGYCYWVYLYFNDSSAGEDLIIYGVKLNYNIP